MKQKPMIFGILLLIFSMLTLGCISPPSSQNITITNLSYKIETGSNPVLGNADASITIVEFTDYQCPYCKKYAVETFPLIEENYVKTSKLKYYLRDFPLTQIHYNSNSTALAARCAGEQGKYWEMHSLLFEKQSEWSGISANQLNSKFVEYASFLGINDAPFSSCLASGKAAPSVSNDVAAAQIYGISGTPSSIVLFPKTANETKLLAVLSAYPEYSSRGMLSLSRDSEGNYAFFIKGAFPYGIFQKVLESAQ